MHFLQPTYHEELATVLHEGYSFQKLPECRLEELFRNKDDEDGTLTVLSNEDAFTVLVSIHCLVLQVGNMEDHVGCCQECRALPRCTHFTFDYLSGNCYLKSGMGSQQSKEGLVSGAILSG